MSPGLAPPALPTRQGVGPSTVGLPAGPWPLLIDFLIERFPRVPPAELARRLAAGEIVDGQGRPLAPGTPYAACQPLGRLHYWRALPAALEAPPAQEERLVFEDEYLVVADKPHFMSVTPSGAHLHHCLLARLKRRLGLETLAPLHRIDRETAGLVLFTKQPATRGAYQGLFEARAVHKVYQAVAPWRDDLALPLTRQSVIEPDPAHFMLMRERPAAAGAAAAPAITRVEPMARAGPWAHYRLTPATGKRHQLRVHMAALGLPIKGDRLYPVLAAAGADDPRDPLQLLAAAIAFRDPVTGAMRRFASTRTLSWPLPAADHAMETPPD